MNNVSSKINSKIVLFSSPAGAGKTYAIKYLRGKGMKLVDRPCKEHLHKLTMMFFNVPEGRYWEIYNNRELKKNHYLSLDWH